MPFLKTLDFFVHKRKIRMSVATELAGLRLYYVSRA